MAELDWFQSLMTIIELVMADFTQFLCFSGTDINRCLHLCLLVTPSEAHMSNTKELWRTI